MWFVRDSSPLTSVKRRPGWRSTSFRLRRAAMPVAENSTIVNCFGFPFTQFFSHEEKMSCTRNDSARAAGKCDPKTLFIQPFLHCRRVLRVAGYRPCRDTQLFHIHTGSRYLFSLYRQYFSLAPHALSTLHTCYTNTRQPHTVE